jgi:hypothetical protein
VLIVAGPVLALVVVEQLAVVAAAVERVPDEKVAFPAEGKLVALRLFDVVPHKAAVPAGYDVAGKVRSLDIVVLQLAEALALEVLALEVLAYAVGVRVHVVACLVHCVGCR